MTLSFKQLDATINFLNGLGLEHIDFEYHMNEDITSVDELLTAIDDNDGFTVECIYYHNAMEYLIENDASLTESMGIATEMGFTTESINSELLATLLMTENCRRDFYDAEGEISGWFEGLDYEDEDEDEDGKTYDQHEGETHGY